MAVELRDLYSYIMTKYLCFLLIALVIATSGWVHQRAGLSFPVPWDDEPIFTWPAQSVGESGQLQTDHLNPERTVFYHLPGYPVLMGLYFKAIPASLASARWFSWLMTVVAYLLLLAMVRGFKSRILAEVAISLYFLSGLMIIAGNIARPEALVIALTLGGFWMLIRERPWSAASLLSLVCLVHPVGTFLIGFAALAYFRLHRLKIPRPAKSEYGWMALALVTGVAMVTYWALHWSWVWNDLQVGLNFMPLTWGERLASLKPMRQWVPAVIATALVGVTWRMKPTLFLLAMLGWIFWFLPVFRPEMWYEIYTALSYILATVVLIEIAACYSKEKYRTVAPLLVMGGVLFAANRQGQITDPRHYPDYLWWHHMRIRTAPAYILPSDVAAISKALEPLSTDSAGSFIEFDPSGDGLLFIDQLPSNLTSICPAFIKIQPAAIVFHLSALAHPAYTKRTLEQMKQYGVDVERPTSSRDGTEKWYVHLLKK